MTDAPLNLRAIRADRVLEILWPPDELVRHSFFQLRCECPCAGCLNEFTGERTLDPATVPAEITPMQIEFSGNYALKIHWSDGHNTGLYSWDHLRKIGPG